MYCSMSVIPGARFIFIPLSLSSFSRFPQNFFYGTTSLHSYFLRLWSKLPRSNLLLLLVLPIIGFENIKRYILTRFFFGQIVRCIFFPHVYKAAFNVSWHILFVKIISFMASLRFLFLCITNTHVRRRVSHA